MGRVMNFNEALSVVNRTTLEKVFWIIVVLSSNKTTLKKKILIPFFCYHFFCWLEQSVLIAHNRQFFLQMLHCIVAASVLVLYFHCLSFLELSWDFKKIS